MKQSQFNDINDAIKDRSDWELRQSTWYKLRHTGIGRSGKPYPNAPDMHFPLADTLIEKLKAFYIQLIYGNETISSFIATRSDTDTAAATAACNWFDHQLKQNSNFEEEIMVAIDQMLQGDGKLPLKLRWSDGQLRFDAIDRLQFIVPTGCQNLDDADWCVHVIQMSKAKYLANDQFNHQDEYVDRISGRGNREESGQNLEQQIKDAREGVHYSENDDIIIIWECYIKDRVNNKISVETVSPLLPTNETPIRAPFTLPYTEGVFKDGLTLPFATIRTEIKDKGWYSERGVPHVVFQFEQAINKNCNTIKQWEDYFGQPQFRATKSVANSTNFRSRPGAVAPDGLEPIPPTPLPQGAMEEREFWRAVAEYRISTPDLSANQHLQPQAKRGVANPTATEVNAIVGQSSMTQDVRARVFRLDCGSLLNLAWSLCLQYGQDSLEYLCEDELQEVDPSIFHDDYIIRPSGSADSWNKQVELQKAIQMYQMLGQNPYIALDELTKMLLERDRPENVKRLFRDPGIKQQDQAEQQATECILMLNGWPAQVHPSDDDKTHLMTEGQFFQRRMMTGDQITPELARLGLQHGQAHDQALQQKKDKALPQIRAQMKPLVDALMMIAQSDQQQPGNVVPMQPGGQGGPSQPQGPQGPQQSPQQQQAKESIAINYKDAPPSIQRQMEAAAGFQPASMQEAITAEALRKAKSPVPQPQPQQVIPGQ